jgi:hypothetical protein
VFLTLSAWGGWQARQVYDSLEDAAALRLGRPACLSLPQPPCTHPEPPSSPHSTPARVEPLEISPRAAAAEPAACSGQVRGC